MGTTRTAIEAGTGVRLAYCLIIEGYSRPLTNWHDLSAVDTAWASTDFTGGALPGLEIVGNIEQRYSPLSADLSVPTLTFRVIPDGDDDTFATFLFKTTPDAFTRMAQPFNIGDTTLYGKANGGFSTEGIVYIGGKALQYTSLSGGSDFVISQNGKYYPFDTDAGASNVFPGKYAPNSNESVNGWKNTTPPYITDSPRDWTGKVVSLTAHRVVDGVLDQRSQAEVLFAGKIDSYGEEQDGATILECSDLRGRIQDHISFQDQWHAVPEEGFRFVAGMWFDASILDNGAATFSGINKLVCVAGTPADDSEFQEGYYSAEEIAVYIERWLNVIGLDTGDYTWTCGVYSSADGVRFRIQGERGSAMTTASGLSFGASDRRILTFLGFESINYRDWPTMGDAHVVHGESRTTTLVTLVAEAPPYRIDPILSPKDIQVPFANELLQWQPSLEVVGTMGTFHDMTTHLPPEVQAYVGDSEVWSFFSINDKAMFLGKVDSASAPTKITDIHYDVAFASSKSAAANELANVRVGGSLPVIKQVLTIAGTFEDVLTYLMASIDGDGSNQATYDVLPDGVGLAIPWGILGQNWLDSCNELGEAADDSTVVVLEKPTATWSLIASDLAARGAFIVWKQNGYQLQTLKIPNASNADWTISDDTMAFPLDRTSRVMVQHTDEYLISKVKIEYNREPLTDDYRDTFIAIGSNPQNGKPLTLRARNAYSADKGAGSAVEDLAEALTSQHLAVFNRPVRRWKAALNPQQFLAAPGDSVAFSSNFVRDPTTGARGVTSRGGTILSVSYSFGVGSGQTQSMNGSAEILFSDEDRFFPLAPAAESDESLGASAWSAGTKKLYLKENAFSHATDNNDNLNFADTDAIKVVEVDPASPASADAFSDVINGAPGTDATGDYIILTNGFGAGGRPSFDSTKIYLVMYDAYSSCTASQRLKAFQADATDGLIENLIGPNLFGNDKKLGSSRPTVTRLPARHANELYGEGVPLTPAHIDHFIRIFNNALNYRSQVCNPIFQRGGTVVSLQSDGAKECIRSFPHYIGGGAFSGGVRRKLYVAPCVRVASGSDIKIRVTLTGRFASGDASNEDLVLKPPRRSYTWSPTNSSIAVLSTQSLTPVRMPSDRHSTMVYVEAWTESGSGASLEFYGLSALYTGPME